MSSDAPRQRATHPDDEFHEPTSDHPEWTETMWFAYSIPERRLSGQLYVYARRNLGVVASSAFVWDRLDDQVPCCRYAKTFWHLPFPDRPLSDLALDNGLRYRALAPQQAFELRYDDPDCEALHVELTYEAIVAPHYLHTHLDQPGRFTGRIVIEGEELPVDCFGFRDRSWGVRSQFGPNVMHTARYASYSYGTASEGSGFFTMQAAFGEGPLGEGLQNVHGFLLRDGRLSSLTAGTRRVLDRSTATGNPTLIGIEGTDALGRSFRASGTPVNSMGIQLNPNLYTVNGLVPWQLEGPVGVDEAIGEDHDNWSVAGFRAFARFASR